MIDQSESAADIHRTSRFVCLHLGRFRLRPFDNVFRQMLLFFSFLLLLLEESRVDSVFFSGVRHVMDNASMFEDKISRNDTRLSC